MARAVGFSARNAAGTVNMGGDPLPVGSGDAVPINLTQRNAISDLPDGKVLTLTNGRKIVLSGDFEVNADAEDRLFLSACSGGFGVAAASLEVFSGLSGGGDEDGAPARAQPTVDDPTGEQILLTASTDPSIITAGTGELDCSVVVATGTTVITDDGAREVVFPGTGLPEEGDEGAEVTVTGTDDCGPVVLDGPNAFIDPIPPGISATIGTVATGHVENVADCFAGVTIGCVVRPGEEILQTLPLDEEPFLKAKEKPRSIASVRERQGATIKLSASE